MDWPAWLVAIGTILLVGATVWAAIRSTRGPKKRLSYEVVSDFPLIRSNVYSKSWGELKIGLADRSVANPRSVTFRVINSGRAEVRPTDVIEPLGVRFSASTKIVAARATLHTDSDPSGTALDLKISDDEASVSVAPLLINRGDRIEFHVLGDGDGEVKVAGRVAGFELRPVVERRLGELFEFALLADLPVLLIVGLIVAGLSFLLHAGDAPTERMPNLYGDRVAQVKTEMKPHIFLNGRVFQIESSRPKGTVVYQSIPAGAEITGGQTLDIGLSNGRGDAP